MSDELTCSSAMWSRRNLLVGGAALLFTPGCATSSSSISVIRLAELERQLGGGRLGVVAHETSTGRRLSYRPDDRFAMCSTFKWALGALVLLRVDQGQLSLDKPIPYSQADVVPHSPVTGRRLSQGSTLTVGQLCAATIRTSDNTAANLLLREIGGPPEFTKGMRSFGDRITRLDRWEVELNSNLPGDMRDTTSPAAMADLLRSLLTGRHLSISSRAQLMGWMASADTGLDRLRGGLPDGWRAGDKTGTGLNGANGDVAFARNQNTQIYIASYMNAPGVALAQQNAIHRHVAALAVRELAG